MIDTFMSGGILMWPLLFIGLGVLALAARAVWLLRSPAHAPAAVEAPLQAVLFWGIMAALLGVIGTTAGFIQMAHAIAANAPVRATLVWGGVGVALVTLVFGVVILCVAVVLWFGLRWWAPRHAAQSHRPPLLS